MDDLVLKLLLLRIRGSFCPSFLIHLIEQTWKLMQISFDTRIALLLHATAPVTLLLLGEFPASFSCLCSTELAKGI